MLEDAILQVLHFSVDDIDKYISHRDYTLVKLHGSVNWGREIDGGLSPHTQSQQTLIDGVAGLQISERYRRVTGCPMLGEGTTGLVFPALAIPVENKDVFECPKTHVDRLERLLANVDRVITVGWRASEAEFLGLFEKWVTNRGLKLMIVSGDQRGAEETLANLTKNRPLMDSSVSHLDDGFTGLLLRHLDKLEAFLRN